MSSEGNTWSLPLIPRKWSRFETVLVRGFDRATERTKSSMSSFMIDVLNNDSRDQRLACHSCSESI